MREFGVEGVTGKLLTAGFREVDFFLDDMPEIGIIFDSDVSLPVISRKDPFALSLCARGQMIDLWRADEDRLAEARGRAASAQTEALRERERAEALARQMQLAAKLYF